MARRLPNCSTTLSNSQPNRAPIRQVTPITAVTQPRYHLSFQDFLDDIDAAYYNPLPANAHLV